MSALSETTVDNEVIFSIEGMDTTTSVAGIETVVEDLDALKYDVGELKDLLNNNKGEINHVRRIVLACERCVNALRRTLSVSLSNGCSGA